MIDISQEMLNYTTQAMSQLVKLNTSDGKSYVSTKPLPVLLQSNQLDVEQEISLANSITEATIAFIATHDVVIQQNKDESTLLLTLLENFNNDVANKKTAAESFLGFVHCIMQIENENESLKEFPFHQYLSTVFAPTLMYLKSISARQGVFLPELLNNEMRNGVCFDLFKQHEWEQMAFTQNKANVLYSLYDEDLIDLALNELENIISGEQLNYLYHYLGLTAYQITFGSLNAMQVIEKLTGLNFGFERENITHPNKQSRSLKAYLQKATEAKKEMEALKSQFKNVDANNANFDDSWQ